MSAQEFEKQIKAGKKLVILDEMVLDISKFIDYHPGGKFVLQVNTGRDISKFFYGGYALEGNTPGSVPKGYNHSNYAKLVIESLVVGVYMKQTSPQTTLVEMQKGREPYMWNSTTGTVFFESDKPAFRHFYEGLDFCGKHYKLRCFEN